MQENMLKVNLPDGSVLEYSRRVRPIDIATDIGPRLAKATLAAQVGDRLIGVDQPLPEEGEILRALGYDQRPVLDDAAAEQSRGIGHHHRCDVGGRHDLVENILEPQLMQQFGENLLARAFGHRLLDVIPGRVAE